MGKGEPELAKLKRRAIDAGAALSTSLPGEEQADQAKFDALCAQLADALNRQPQTPTIGGENRPWEPADIATWLKPAIRTAARNAVTRNLEDERHRRTMEKMDEE